MARDGSIPGGRKPSALLQALSAAAAVLQRPWVTVVSLALLIVGIGVIPNGLRGRRSVNVCNVPWRYIPEGPGPLDVAIAVHEGRVLIADYYDELAEQLDRSGSQGDFWSKAAGGEIAVTTYGGALRDEYHGWLGFTSVIHKRSISHHSGRPIESDLVSEPVRPMVVEAIVQHYEQSKRPGVPEAAAKFREFLGERTERLWLGYVYNAIIVSAAIIGFWSLGWVEEVPGWLRKRGRHRSLAAGRCPRCGYSLVGLRPEQMTCPECGEGLGQAAVGGGGGVRIRRCPAMELLRLGSSPDAARCCAVCSNPW